MINTEKQIQDSFMKLIERYPIDEIDVNKICKNLNIKRQTFYYHFKNIYDVIFSIFCYQKVGDGYEADISSIYNTLFTFLFKDQSFNSAIAKSNANEVLVDFLSSYVSLSLNRNLDRYNLRINDKKEITRFYSRAISEQCIYYFCQGDYSIKEGCEKMNLIFNEDILRDVIRKYQNSID